MFPPPIPPMSPSPEQIEAQLKQVEERFKTMARVMTTRYPVAQTPKEVIWTLNKAKLYRYVPVLPPEQRKPVPLFLVFALMNRPYIFDLRPGNSFVEYMVSKGYDVYLMDWGVPGLEDKNLRLDDYVLEYLPRAIRKIKSASGCEEFNMLGWCLGAIVTTCYAALRADAGLRSLILLTPPLDFSNRDAGGFVGMATDQNFDVDKILERYGNMPGEMIAYAARALRPVENYITNYMNLWDNAENPRVLEAWHAMNTWVNDNISMTGGFYRQLIKELYSENRLYNKLLKLRGEKVDVAQVKADLLMVIAESDHIVPPCQSDTIVPKFGSQDKTVLRVPGGHIGIMAGSGAVQKTWPQIERWLAQRSG